MTMCLLFVLPKNIGNKNPSFKKLQDSHYLKWFIILNLQISILLQRWFKTLKYLISQNEKENQKTDIVNM